MTPAFLTGLDMLRQMQSLTGCCDTQPPVVVYRDRPAQSQPAAAVPDDGLQHKAGGVAAFLESTLRTNSRDIADWRDDVETAANTLRKALAAAPQAPQQAAKRDDFLQGVCVALAVIRGFDSGTAWAELVRTVGIEQLLNYAAFVEPEEWELAGFNKYAMQELGRRKPRKPLPAPPATPVA